MQTNIRVHITTKIAFIRQNIERKSPVIENRPNNQTNSSFLLFTYINLNYRIMKTCRYTLRLKKAIVIIMALIVSTQLYSQNSNAIGVRLGTDPGITYKHYFGGQGGMELMLHTGYRGLIFTGLYEWHLPFGVPGLQGYLGVGAHIGTLDRWVVARRRHNGKVDYVYVEQGGRASFGPDGIMGIEYRIPGAPVDIGFDIKPGLDFGPRDYIIGTFNSAFSVRYRF
jgi:hypothetical protein